ncbi:unnamed protein product [Arctogadus glacialis]
MQLSLFVPAQQKLYDNVVLTHADSVLNETACEGAAASVSTEAACDGGAARIASCVYSLFITCAVRLNQ